MAMITVFQANSVDALRNVDPDILDIPVGSEILITIETQWWYPVGPLFNLYGAEWFAQRLVDAEIDVTDVSSPDAHKIEIRGIATGSPVVVLALVLAGILLSIGLTLAIKSLWAQTQVTELGKIKLAEDLAGRGYTAGEITKILEGTNSNDALSKLVSFLPWMAAGLGIVYVSTLLPKKSSK